MRSVFIGLLLTLLPTGSVHGVEAKTIDLADLTPAADVTRPLEPGQDVQFEIHNRIPGRAYNVDVVVEDIELPPLSLNFFSGALGGSPAPPTAGPATSPTLPACTEALLTGEFAGITDESEVPAKMRSVSAAPPRKCTGAEALLQSMTRLTVDGTYSAGKGQQIVVTITRSDGSGSRTVTYSTGAKGRWRTTYGFTFVPNEDETYFARANDDGLFEILEDSDREEFDFAPSVLFSYERPGTDWSWVAGLGHDLSNVIVFLGRGFTIGQNVTITGGVVMHEQTRLAGQYDVGQLLEQTLNDDQLTETTYDANVYVGVSFRLDRDPHAERNRLQREAQKAKEDAAKARAAQQAAEKRAAEEKAQRIAECKATAAVAHAEAEKACQDGDENLRDACKTAAEAKLEEAKTKCDGDPVGQAAAETARKAAEAALERKTKQEACKAAAEAVYTEAMGPGGCADLTGDAKTQCVNNADTSRKSALVACANIP